ncbi:hypothetical protein ACPEEZ_00555 [Frigoribacterium sp. 2-23]|uniref:hypothetical protein n=1 Tax=Frigoribacterium sp. 2-23 TaxID=3415006 RepID=UPI003C701ADF
MDREHRDPMDVSREGRELSAAEAAGICDALVSAWYHDAVASMEGSASSSQAALDAAGAASRLPEGSLQNLEHAPVQTAGRMVDAIALLVQSLGTLLRAEPLVMIGIWPVVRAEIEYAGRVAWLLEPLPDEGAGLRRVARALLEQLSGLHRQRLTADKWNKTQAKKFKKARDGLRERISEVFDDVDTPMVTPNDIDKWRVGSETMMPLGRAATLFFDLNLIEGKALYDILSDYSHPSVISLSMQSKAATDDDATIWSYPINAETLDFQVRLGCIALYKSALALLNYCGFPSAAIERWAANAPQHWFTSGSQRNE